MKFLVHVHVYYLDIWEDLKKHLLNISDYDYDLFITLINEHKEIADYIREDMAKIKPDVNVITVKNQGYDVGPFFYILNKVNLNDYEYVIKLHSKRNIPSMFNKKDLPYRNFLNRYPMYKSNWRNNLLEFVNCKKNLEKCISAFEKDKKLGMISSHKVIVSHIAEDKEIYRNAISYLKKRNINATNRFKFVAGTVFIARTEIFKELLKLNIKFEHFKTPRPNDHDSLAHVMERVFGAFTNYKGYKIEDVLHVKHLNFFHIPVTFFFFHMLYFLFQYHVNKNNVARIKFCKIPVFKFRLKQN